MTDPLWSKPGQSGADEQVQAFLAGEDVKWDRYLLPFDIQATAAHVDGLARIGIVSDDEAAQVSQALQRLAADFSSGKFILGPPAEDGHSAIEQFLTAELGDTGRKVHTGRSRNDQVQVALRLYMRDRLARLKAISGELARELLNRAEQDATAPMPGYTHLQRAVPSSVGLWLGGLAEAFIDIAELARLTSDWLNTSPLGTAAGYGVNLPLDREGVSEDLGFSRLQINPQYAQNCRGRFELQALTALAQATLELRRLAWDLSLYTSAEFAFVTLPPRYVTGSSIMPNKSNPDTVELLRGQHAVVQGALAELQSVLGLPSGYHRDLQLTKPPLIRAFESSLAGLALAPAMVRDMQLDLDAMAKAIDADMFATDVAVDAARQGVPFRDAYRSAMDASQAGNRSERGAKQSLEARVSPGGCADLRLDTLRERLELL